MDLHQYLQIFRRHWRSIVGMLLLSVGLAVGLVFVQNPTYSSSASIFLTVRSGASASELYQGVTYTESQVASYVTVAGTARVLDPVIEEFGLDYTTEEFAEEVSITSPTGTSIIEVAVEDGDAQRSADLSNAVADSLVLAVDELSPPDPDGERLVSALVIDPALASDEPVSPQPVAYVAAGILVGLALGLGQALFRGLLDTRVRTFADLQPLVEAPLLGSVPALTGGAERALDETGAQWAKGEAYRRLRTNVAFVGLGGERKSSMVVTSALASEGKTETITNLARVLAQAGETVLLIDADLREPQVANRMRLDNGLGLSDVLTGRAHFQQVMIPVNTNLTVLTSGTVPPNPSELLGSGAMSQLLAMVEQQYDYVLFDAPPLLPVTDAVVLAKQTAGAIVVARSGMVRTHQVEAALALLDAVDAEVLGFVITGGPADQVTSYQGYLPKRDDQTTKKTAGKQGKQHAHR